MEVALDFLMTCCISSAVISTSGKGTAGGGNLASRQACRSCSCSATGGLKVALYCFLGESWCCAGVVVIIQNTLGKSPKISVACLPLTLSVLLLFFSFSFLGKLAIPLH